MVPEGVLQMTKSSSKTDTQDRGRFSARRKTEAVLRHLRGEDLDTLSRELGVVAATLSGWRDTFLDGGTAAMKSRPVVDQDPGAIALWKERLRESRAKKAVPAEVLAARGGG
jgi:Transposase